jgi:hydroxypyruvate isomerase
MPRPSLRFSANLGFLWTDRSLPDAIRAAKSAGFAAVECHWPYNVASADVAAALSETGLSMLSLNTRRGDEAAGDNGLAAVPGREVEARAAIDEAIAYARTIGAEAVHVMAGRAGDQPAHDTFVANLTYATGQAAVHGTTILIESLNQHDAPGYFLRTTEQARDLIAEVGAPNLKLMFDCYHVGRTEGDVVTRLHEVAPDIGHIQFASVPDRGTPDHGDVDYRVVFAEIQRIGWDRPLGAEYRPVGPSEESLSWMQEHQ